MDASEFFNFLDQLLGPARFDWDFCGLQFKSQKKSLRRVALAVGLTKEVLKKCVSWKADALVVHHPLIFVPQKSFDVSHYPESLLFELYNAQTHLYVAHTNLDSSTLGASYRAAHEFLKDLEKRGIKAYIANEIYLEGSEVALQDYWTEIVIEDGCSVAVSQIAEYFEKFYDSKPYITAIPKSLEREKRSIHRIVICSGSGSSLASRDDFDVLITGEIGFHQALDAKERGQAVLAFGHYETELCCVKSLGEYLKKNFDGIEFRVMEDESSRLRLT